MTHRARSERAPAAAATLLVALLLGAGGVPQPASAWAIRTTAGGAPVRWERFPVQWRGLQVAGPETAWRGRVVRRGVEAWNLVGETPVAIRYQGPVAGAFAAADGASGLYFVESDWPVDLGDVDLVAAATLVEFDDATGFIREADVGFNGIGFRWADERPRRDALDLWSIAVHESGHLLGLEHTCDAPGQPACATATSELVEAAMFPAAIPGDPMRRSAAPDDLAGLTALYGDGAQPTPSGRVQRPACAGDALRFTPEPGSPAIDRVEAVDPASGEVVSLGVRLAEGGVLEVEMGAAPPGGDLVVVGPNGKSRTYHGALRSAGECASGCGRGRSDGAAAAVLLLVFGWVGGRA